MSPRTLAMIEAEHKECIEKMADIAIFLFRPITSDSQKKVFTDQYKAFDLRITSLNLELRNLKVS